MQVRFDRDFNPAEAGAGVVATVGHEPLAGKQVIELFEVRVECHETRAGEECLAARLVGQAVE